MHSLCVISAVAPIVLKPETEKKSESFELERAFCSIMGVSSQPCVVSPSLKDLLQGTEENKNASYGYLWSKVLAAQGMKRKKCKKSVKSGTPRRILMKRRARLIEGFRRRAIGIKTRVRTLKRLVPNSESVGLDGLFRETAEYILSLQMRVRVMQIMVNVLGGSDE